MSSSVYILSNCNDRQPNRQTNEKKIKKNNVQMANTITEWQKKSYREIIGRIWHIITEELRPNPLLQRHVSIPGGIPWSPMAIIATTMSIDFTRCCCLEWSKSMHHRCAAITIWPFRRLAAIVHCTVDNRDNFSVSTILIFVAWTGNHFHRWIAITRRTDDLRFVSALSNFLVIRFI